MTARLEEAERSRAQVSTTLQAREARLAALEKEHTERVAEVTRLQGQLGHRAQEEQALRQDLAAAQEESKRLHSQHAQLAAARDELAGEKVAIGAQLVRVQAALREEEGKVGSLNKTLAAMQIEKAKLVETKGALEGLRDRLTRELEQERKVVLAQKAELSRLEDARNAAVALQKEAERRETEAQRLQKLADQEKAAAEAQRARFETDMQAAQRLQQKAEEAHTLAQRVTHAAQEQARLAEAARAAAETARLAAEKAQRDEIALKQRAEATRLAEEQLRQRAEAARLVAETAEARVRAELVVRTQERDAIAVERDDREAARAAEETARRAVEVQRDQFERDMLEAQRLQQVAQDARVLAERATFAAQQQT